ATLRRDYGLPELPPVERVFGVVGERAMVSLSPRLHNTAYRELGLPFLYLPFPVSRFGPFWLEVVEAGRFDALELPLTGLSVTAPHKGAAAAVAGALSPLADFLDAVNTLVHNEGVWEGESTDGAGVVHALRSHGVVPERAEVAVVGAGGAGRAAAWALAKQGARVVLVNRDSARGRIVAQRLRVAFLDLDAFQPERFPVVVHATSLGGDDGDPLPFEPRRLGEDAVLVDLVYRQDRPTPLVAAARASGRLAVDGREVLLGQAIPQFHLMTGRELPRDAARRCLDLEDVGGVNGS
ncbi:MAG: shikimate dehydrogenase family protein, partial [Thermoanaerobaculia bacterium]